jgi:hypothetical protein
LIRAALSMARGGSMFDLLYLLLLAVLFALSIMLIRLFARM